MKSGIDLRYVDAAVRPQDDLFRHVNGGWLSTAEIPSDKARYGEFMRLRDEAEAQLRGIVDRLAAGSWEAGSDEQKIADLYRAFMDTDRIDSLGVEPLVPLLARVDEVDSVESLLSLVGQLERRGTAGLFGSYVDTDRGDSTRYLVYLNQGGLGLPDESYYADERFAQIRVDYVAHVQRLLDLAGVGDGDAAHRVMEVETRLATAHWDRVATRDATATYNLLTYADLAALAPALPWRAWLSALGARESTLAEVVVRQPSFFAALSSELGEVDLAAWRAWLRWKVVHSAAPYLTEDFVAENFSFYGQTLSGVPADPGALEAGHLPRRVCPGGGAGASVRRRALPPHAKARMQGLVANVVAAYRERISALEWMTPATRARPWTSWPPSRRRSATPTSGATTPRSRSSRTTCWAMWPGGRVRDRPRAGEARHPGRSRRVAHDPADGQRLLQPRAERDRLPGGDPAAAVLRRRRRRRRQLRGIGAVIGHEIGHGFDDQGSQVRRRRQPAQLVDRRRPRGVRRAGRIADHAVRRLRAGEHPGHTVNGALTVGENIGDLGGLAIAAHAYRIALDGATAPVIDGLSGMQRLMFGWAQVWREKSRSEEAIRLLAIDPHSPPEFRCNGTVRNVAEFHEAFGTVPGDGLWMEPDSRVGIW